MMRVKVTQRKIPPHFEERVKERLDKVIQETAREMASIAYQLAPKDTGFMAGSIAVEGEIQYSVLRVVVGANYAKYVEFGTRFQGAQPFLRPAQIGIRKRLRRRLGQVRKGIADELGTNTRVQKG